MDKGKVQGLTLTAVEAFYGRHRALADVSAHVGGEESVALVGRNGAGKTTLLRTLVNGFGVGVGSGDVVVDGVRVNGWSPERIIGRFDIGFVPDDRRIVRLSVLENLLAAAVGGKDRRERVESALEMFPLLKGRERQLATTLSGGEQQALAIARAAVRRPRYLVLDEPAEGLAPIAIDAVMEGISNLQNSYGCALLLVERNLDFVEKLCSRVYGMANGEIVWEGSVQSLRSDEELVAKLLLPAG
jgi:branched-chain amino acid transport system ATP-binding protein